MRITATMSLLLLVLCSSCVSRKLVNPDPVSLDGYGGTIRAVIIDSLGAQSWLLSREEPGRIHAKRLVNGKHEMQVLLSYDTDSVRIEYEGSKNLGYSKFLWMESIHKNYKVWTDALRWEIDERLAYARSGNSR